MSYFGPCLDIRLCECVISSFQVMRLCAIHITLKLGNVRSGINYHFNNSRILGKGHLGYTLIVSTDRADVQADLELHFSHMTYSS